MRKGTAPCHSPELLKVLAEMGHGDENVLAGAHFPSHRLNTKTIQADAFTRV
jgi:L-fucose mutarotase